MAFSFATRSVLLAWIDPRFTFDPLRRRLPGGTVLVFADPADLGFPIFFPLQRAADPFFVGLLFAAFVGPDRLNRLCFACISHRGHTTGRSFDSLS